MTDLENVNRLLDDFKNCPDTGLAIYFNRAVDLFRHLPNADKKTCARGFYDWAEENKEKESLRLGYARLLMALGFHLSEENETALQFFTKARESFAEQNDQDGLAICAVLIGSIYRTFGNFDLALKTLWEGYGGLKESGKFPIFLAACYHAMANVHLELQNYDGALSMFTSAYELSTKINDYYFTVYSLHGLGKVYTRLKKYTEAQGYLEKALQLAENSKNQLQIANSISELAVFYFTKGDLIEAGRLDHQALAIREANNFVGGAVTNCIHLGEIYIRQSKWDKALEVLNKGLALAEQIKVKPKIYQVHFLLSQIYENMNDLKQSLFHFKLFQQIQQQVEREDSVRKLADAKLIFEAEQTRKENVVIKKQKQEIEKKNIELQETIDELTLTKISRRAKALTLVIAVVLFIIQDFFLVFVLEHLPGNSYLLSLIVKMVIIFSLSPINKGVEKYLLHRVILGKKKNKSAEPFVAEVSLVKPG